MPTLLELADRLWNGLDKTSDAASHPFAPLNQIEELAPGVAFCKEFSNLAAVRTGDGLVLLDTGSFNPRSHERQDRVHTAVYSRVRALPRHRGLELGHQFAIFESAGASSGCSTRGVRTRGIHRRCSAMRPSGLGRCGPCRR